MAVRIYLQMFRFARLAGGIDRDVLVLEPEFFERPESSSGSRPCGAINFYHFDSSIRSDMREMRIHAIRFLNFQLP
jgi:hypothetical protein